MKSILHFALLAILYFCVAGVATAQQTLRIVEGEGEAIRLDRAAASVFVADPGVADIQAVSDETLLITGISAGTTNVFALDFNDEQIVQYRVVVLADTSAASGVLGGTRGNVRVQPSGNGGVLVGTAGSIGEAIAALDAQRGLEAEGRPAVNRTGLGEPTQVALRVRFAEVSRDDMFQLGFDFSAVNGSAFRVATGGGVASDFLNGISGIGDSFTRAGVGGNIGSTDIDLVLDAMERVGIVQILAEPTLTTVSGKRAKFRAGGEFAFPVNQGDGVITAEYKETGISLDFLPTVLPNNRLAIEVRPEVSFVDAAQGVEIEGFSAPSLSVRSAETTVEVASGQTFAIAGLYERQATDADTGVPGLRRAPLIGALFNTKSQRRTERELVIFITALIVDASDASARAPASVPASDLVGFIVK